jgi:hypothetical protein
MMTLSSVEGAPPIPLKALRLMYSMYSFCQKPIVNSDKRWLFAMQSAGVAPPNEASVVIKQVAFPDCQGRTEARK